MSLNIINSAKTGETIDVTDLLAYYTFEQTSGNLLNVSQSAQSAGVNGDGVNTGAVSQTNAGLISNAYDYTGGKTTLGTVKSTFNEPLSSTAKWSMVLWLNPNSLGADAIVFDNQNSTSSNNGMRMRNNTNGTFTFVVSNAGASVVNSGVTTIALSAGVWQMVAMTFDFSLGSNNYKVSINDGTPENTNTSTLGTDTNPVFDLTLGEAAVGNDGIYNGLMDEVSFWNRVLTPAEITLLYNNGDGFSI